MLLWEILIYFSMGVVYFAVAATILGWLKYSKD